MSADLPRAAEAPTDACKNCAFFLQTYRHDIEREDHAYQIGTCSAPMNHHVRGHSAPSWESVDRDDVRKCFVAERPARAGRGFF